jgi:aryl-alcohol dehydrogenase (NADP+)
MRWKSFGTSGLKVTELCLGTMTLGGQANQKTSFAILDAAFEGGIRFLDTADAYPVPMLKETLGATEVLLGKWMALKRNRDQLVVATKGYFPTGPLPIHQGNARLHLLKACEASLHRLKTDYVDLYLCHGWDPTVPVEETLRALEQLRQDGKIRYAALSNVRSHEAAEALVAAERLGIAEIQGVQPRYNIFQREGEESLFPLARRFGLGVMVYNPLAGGLLSAKHQPGKPPAKGTRFALPQIGEVYRQRYWDELLLNEALELKKEAEKQRLSLVTASVAWVLTNPDVTSAIIGASKPQQLADNLKSAEVRLPPRLKERLDRVWFDLPRRPPNLDSPRIANWYAE